MKTFAEYAALFIGVRQGSKTHKDIIDSYNNIKPLPRGYRVTYTDSWCAAFASVVMYACGAMSAPYECSVYYMWEKAQTNKQTVKTPKVNDFIIYNWNSDSVPDHVGVISKINGDTLTVIEGNYSRQVKTRTISKKSKYIVGYIRLKQQTAETNNKSNEEIAKEVISGKWGNGAERKKKLTAAGYDYDAIQKIVNELI